MRNALFVSAAIAACLVTAAISWGDEWTITSQSASSALGLVQNGCDSNKATIWSSNMHKSSSGDIEWYAYMFDTFHDVNYVRLTPRFSGKTALGFPETFYIHWFDGANWNLARTVTNMQRPYRSADIILAFATTVRCNGIRIWATKLRDDTTGNYVFQMAEFHAGYDQSFDRFVWTDNDASSRIEIRSVGARNFNPNRLANWNPDERSPLIEARPGGKNNIYAPMAIKNGNAWSIYFGGWDGTTDGHDRISVTVTADQFMTFGLHTVVINNGVFNHVNNECVIKVADNDWRMAYTTCAGLNKPGYATSSDGVNWTPDDGSRDHLIKMEGYPNWSNADVNGGNVIYHENGTFHLYFDDFKTWPGVFYATSTDNINYTFHAKKLNEGVVCNDMRRLWYGGSNYYMWVYHSNGSTVRYSLGTEPTSLGKLEPLFTSNGDADKHITSVGLVVDGNRLLGALYGAGATSGLSQNRIFAKWLQRRVLFANASVTLGTDEQAYGPDALRIYPTSGKNVETGKFSVYDEDGTTLDFTSAEVTILTGDIWECRLTDTVPPTGSVTIGSGASTASTPVTLLRLSAADTDSGVSRMRFSNDDSNWSDWEPYAQYKAWTLADGNGAKTVYVQFRDWVGNISPTCSDSILLDTTAPD